MTERTPRAAAAIAAMKAGASYEEAQAAYLAAPTPVPDEDHGYYLHPDAQGVTFTASAETAARMAEKQVVGLSIRGEDLPAPVPAREHVSIMESKTHPGVVWPL
jgi:hypothetical protein